MENQEKIKIVTHNGSFHTDELFACAFLKILYPNAAIVRSRDAAVISTGDIVLDVGGIYDPEKNRFDHHQRGGAGVRENGIPYASLGLTWKHFGEKLCEGNKAVWEKIERKIVMPTDAIDNGIVLFEESIDDLIPYTADQIFLSFSPTWKEGEEKIDPVFNAQVEKVKEVLQRELSVALDDVAGAALILSALSAATDKRIVTIDRPLPRYLYQETLAKTPEAVFIVLPREPKEGAGEDTEEWKVEAIRKNLLTMESRKYFPPAWRGLYEADLQKVSGVQSATFCHNSGFLAATRTKEDALKIAQIGLDS